MENTPDNKWIEQHDADPRFPTKPEYVELRALSQQYSISEEKILELALTRPGSCLRSDGNPWVDHGSADKSLYFHEPTLRAAVTSNAV